MYQNIRVNNLDLTILRDPNEEAHHGFVSCKSDSADAKHVFHLTVDDGSKSIRIRFFASYNFLWPGVVDGGDSGLMVYVDDQAVFIQHDLQYKTLVLDESIPEPIQRVLPFHGGLLVVIQETAVSLITWQGVVLENHLLDDIISDFTLVGTTLELNFNIDPTRRITFRTAAGK